MREATNTESSRTAHIVVASGAFALLVALAVALAPSDGLAEVPGEDARIAFASGGRIISINAQGGDRVPLSGRSRPSRSRVSDTAPAYSPDGESIAFVHTRGEHSQIFVMNADGSGREPVTEAARSYPGDPQWSPNGEQLVFARWRSSRSALLSSIVVVPRAGGEERVVARARAHRTYSILREPTWSPGGDQIAFTKTTLDRDYYFRPSLYLVGSDGGRPRLLARDASSADFSPDGSLITFASIRDQNGESCGSDECSYSGEIYVMDGDGSNPVRLTHNKGDDRYPDWSADGDRIAFASDRNYPQGESPELYSIGADGGCMTWLTNGTAPSDEPDWQPRSGASTEPGGCGASSRKPLVEARIGKALEVEGYRPFWLGRRFRQLLLTDVIVGRNSVSALYWDCASYWPRDCRSPLEVQSWNTCKRFRDLYPGHQDSFRFRGAQAMHNPFAGSFEVYTGRTTLVVFAARRRNFDRRTARALRRIGSDTIPSRLRPPVEGSLKGKLPCQRQQSERFG